MIAMQTHVRNLQETLMGVSLARASGVFVMEDEREGNGTQHDWLSVAFSQARQVIMYIVLNFSKRMPLPRKMKCEVSSLDYK